MYKPILSTWWYIEVSCNNKTLFSSTLCIQDKFQLGWCNPQKHIRNIYYFIQFFIKKSENANFSSYSNPNEKCGEIANQFWPPWLQTPYLKLKIINKVIFAISTAQKLLKWHLSSCDLLWTSPKTEQSQSESHSSAIPLCH